MREQLNLENSLLQNLTDDPNIQNADKAGQILVQGKSKHVAGYLRFLIFWRNFAASKVTIWR